MQLNLSFVDVLGLVCPDYKILLLSSHSIFSQDCVVPIPIPDMKTPGIWATAFTVFVTVLSAQTNNEQGIVDAIFASATAGMISSYYVSL